MIVYTASDSFLEIPKGLGNFASNGDGGGQDLGPLSGSVVELQENVGNLSGSVQTLTSEVGELSGITEGIGDAVADLLLDVDSIDGRVSGNTDDIAALSAQTISLSGATVSGLSAANEAANSAYTLADSAMTAVENIKLPKVVYLNKLTQEELVALYNELDAYFSGTTITSGWTPDDYAFYFAFIEDSDYSGWNGINRNAYQGYYPVQMSSKDSSPSIIFEGSEVADEVRTYTAIRSSLKPDGTISKGAMRITPLTSVPTASSSKLGGIKVGSGLTIDNSGVLSVSGGSEGGGDYKVVSELPASAEKGQLFYIPEHNSVVEHYYYNFNTSNVSEGWVINGSLNGKNLYVSGSNFYWDWDNSATGWTYVDGWGYYKIDHNTPSFTAAFTSPASFNAEQDIIVTSGTTGIPTTIKEKTYRYDGANFLEQPPITAGTNYVINRMSSGETLALYNRLYALVGEKPDTLNNGDRFFYAIEGSDEFSGKTEVFLARYDSSNAYDFSGIAQSRYDSQIHQVGFRIYQNGSTSVINDATYTLRTMVWDLNITISDSGGTITNMPDSIGDMVSCHKFCFLWENQDGGFAKGQLDYYYRQYETVDGEQKLVWHIGGWCPVEGTVYKGTWHWVENQFPSTLAPDTWASV